MSRSWLFFFGALAVGSWVGMRLPDVPAAAPWSGLERAFAKPAPPSPFAAREATDRTAVEFPRLDAAAIPSLDPWPRQNPQASARRAWLLAEGPAPREGDGRMYVTFTFDDGPLPETTSRVLAILEAHRVRATFFVVGRYLDGDEPRAVAARETLRAVAHAGHLVGNHTHDHKLLTAIPHEDAVRQIEEGARSVENAIGRRPTLFRPPYGQLDLWGMAEVASRKLDLVLWSAEAEDMVREDSKAMFESLRDQLEHQRGGTVLLHDVRHSTIPVLEDLLTWLDARAWNASKPAEPGFVVVDYPSYARATAAAPQPYASRAELEHARATRKRPRAVRARPSIRDATEALDVGM